MSYENPSKRGSSEARGAETEQLLGGGLLLSTILIR